MLTFQKFNSFEELKASENKAENYELSLKRHEEYQKFFEHLRSLVVQGEKNSKPK